MSISNVRDPRYHVDAAERTITLLRTLAESGPLTIAGLTAELGWTKPMIYRLVRTLLTCGAVRLGDGGYSLGPTIVSLGYSALKSFRLPDVARPGLKAVHEKTGESAILTILDGTDIVYLDFLETDHLLIFRTARLGGRLPAAITSSGHALLSRHTHDELCALFEGYTFNPPTGHGVASLHDLEERLAQVRTDGYALVDQEVATGHRAAAAPILDHAQRVAAAIAISVPAVRVPLEDLRAMAEEILVPTVKDLSADLGYQREGA